MISEGKYRISAAEVAEWVATSCEITELPAPQYVWLLHEDGHTESVRTGSGDYSEYIGDSWPLILMSGPDHAWANQWAGDWQRACDEQLNPILDQLEMDVP